MDESVHDGIELRPSLGTSRKRCQDGSVLPAFHELAHPATQRGRGRLGIIEVTLLGPVIVLEEITAFPVGALDTRLQRTLSEVGFPARFGIAIDDGVGIHRREPPLTLRRTLGFAAEARLPDRVEVAEYSESERLLLACLGVTILERATGLFIDEIDEKIALVPRSLR